MIAKKIKKLNPEIRKVFNESQVGALLENLDGSIKILAEGQDLLRCGVEDFKKETKNRFDALERDLMVFKIETGKNFKTVLDYLSRIDDELADIKAKLKKIDETKIERQEFNLVLQRLSNAEQAIEEFKLILLKTGKQNH